jgi:hypothetical protein
MNCAASKIVDEERTSASAASPLVDAHGASDRRSASATDALDASAYFATLFIASKQEK